MIWVRHDILLDRILIVDSGDGLSGIAWSAVMMLWLAMRGSGVLKEPTKGGGGCQQLRW